MTIRATFPPEGGGGSGASVPPPPAGEHEQGQSLTDIANAERFVAQHGNKLRYVLKAQHWLIWDGRRWRPAAIEEVERLAKETARDIWSDIASATDTDDRYRIATHAKQSASARAVTAMVRLARSDDSIAVQPFQLDQNPYTLNCFTGTLDLRGQKLWRHQPNNLITKLAPVSYNRKAQCPMWNSFLHRIMAGNQGLLDFLQRAVGYSLTGAVSEQCLFFLYGLGANGKSTFVETILSMLGDYAMHVDSSSLLRQRSETIRADIARLPGARFVAAAEIEEGRRMDETLVKQLTGGGTVTARHLYGAPFDFQPQFKLFVEGNHKPVIRGTDHAIWRRIHLIPFTVTIPEAERDRGLMDKLRAERRGILLWAVEGYKAWREQGLNPPPEVLAATANYQVEMDPLEDFIADCCVRSREATVWKKFLYAWYISWCKQHNVFPLGKNNFGSSLEGRGIRDGRTPQGRYWIGIGLREGLG